MQAIAGTEATATPLERPAPVAGRRAALDVLSQVVGRAGNLLLGVAVTLILVRALGASGFGAWATILTITQLVGYLGDMGFEPVAVRFAAAQPDRRAGWLGALVAVRLALTIPSTAAAVACVVLLSGSSEMAVAGTLVCLTLLLSAPSALRAVFQLRTRNDIPVAVMTLNSIMWTAGAAVLAAAGGQLVAFAALFLAVAVATTTVQTILALRAQPLAFANVLARARSLLRIGIPLGIGGVLTLAYVRIDQLLVFELAGAREAGLYGAVYRILDQAQFVPISLTTTLLPLLSAAYPVDPRRVRRLLQVGLDLLAVASLPALAFTIVAAEPVMRLLFGADFVAAAPALPVLMAAYVLTCFGYVFGCMIVILELQARLVAYSAVALVFNVGLNVLLVPSFGFIAAAWITLATQILVLGVGATVVLRRMPLGLEVRRVAGATASALVMAVTVHALDVLGAPFAALLAVAGAVYVALLLLLRVVQADDLRVLLRSAPA
jgi:O-antigen/teichoic acid export membrane protein